MKNTCGPMLILVSPRVKVLASDELIHELIIEASLPGQDSFVKLNVLRNDLVSAVTIDR